jgi:hypothetical protein
MVEKLERHPSEDDESYACRRGFEHALRNVIATLEKDLAFESNPDRKLGIEIAITAAKGYRGYLLPSR